MNQEWTEEPWDDGTHSWGSAPDGETVLCVPEDDYARAVACVNACAGINPEAVPLMLEALRRIAHASPDRLSHSQDVLIIERAARIAAAAIAKATEARP